MKRLLGHLDRYLICSTSNEETSPIEQWVVVGQSFLVVWSITLWKVWDTIQCSHTLNLKYLQTIICLFSIDPRKSTRKVCFELSVIPLLFGCYFSPNYFIDKVDCSLLPESSSLQLDYYRHYFYLSSSSHFSVNVEGAS